jgi:uncharacterized protein (TIGR03382 family)
MSRARRRRRAAARRVPPPLRRRTAAWLLAVILGLCPAQRPADAAPFLYVADRDLYVVHVIDTATQDFVTAIPVGIGPIPIVANRQGSRVYTLNTTDRTISVIDALSNQVVHTIPATHATDLAVTPDGCRLIVANFTDETPMSVIDTTTYEVVDEFPTSPAGTRYDPTHLALSPDGAHAYLTRCREPQEYLCPTDVADVELSARRTASIVDIPMFPSDLVTDPTGRFVYVVVQTALVIGPTGDPGLRDGIVVLDRQQGNRVVEMIEKKNAQTLAVTGDGRRLWLEAGPASLVEYDAASFQPHDTFDVLADPVNDGAADVALTPDAAFAYVAVLNYLQDYVAVVDLSTRAVVKNIGLSRFRAQSLAMGPAVQSTAVCVPTTAPPSATPTPTQPTSTPSGTSTASASASPSRTATPVPAPGGGRGGCAAQPRSSSGSVALLGVGLWLLRRPRRC